MTALLCWLFVAVFLSQNTSSVSENARFCVADFATLSDKRILHSKIVLLFNMDKRTLHSKFLGILQTELS